MERKTTIARLNRQLKTWDADIARIEKKVQKVTSDLHDRLDELKKRKEAALKRTDALLHSSEEAWGELKEGAEDAFHDVRKAMRRAKAKFR
ncbi:MAG: hypothetical protein HGB01_06135 [Chlorobiaceae bacterium]|nr:hypothetical protein [Chlorobiaceae bacterium]NTV25772.1 hypothetical protein [Chlorobiaceae bacterium]